LLQFDIKHNRKGTGHNKQAENSNDFHELTSENQNILNRTLTKPCQTLHFLNKKSAVFAAWRK